LSFIRFTEPVVIIDVTIPAAVRMTTSDTTLSETIFSIVRVNGFEYQSICANAVLTLQQWARSSTTEQVMFSIQKLLGRDEKFYDLLEASAQQADTSVHQLIELLQKLEQHDTPENLEQFAHSRREDKRITQELTEQLSKTFVTPFEREDIQELASALYKIPKTVEKIGERILICPEDLAGQSFGKQVELLDQAAEMVLAMVKQLRPGIDARTAREMNAKLQGIEGDADKLELERLRDLFKGNHAAKQIIFLHDLYGLLEKVIDRCRDAGNIIVQVALKYA
jgi:uncharacterized protein Yka (UPF0111/DUF47 family)